jgi:precorrin-8X/cobalt-precorrin-8 methylmutase
MPRPRFDSYLMVDWSGANTPRRGRDSIWFCLLQRHGDRLTEAALENPPTRHGAYLRLRDVLRDAVRKKRSILVGFDFPFGFSHGLAARLGVSGPPWRAVWNEIAQLLSDDEENRSNRFAVAAELNRRISGAAFPFWGCPPRQAGPCLAATHHRRHGTDGLTERRLVEGRVRGPQPGWKLLGVGSVGSQALTGIPIVRRLRDDPALAACAKLFPFETGLQPLTKTTGGARVIFAEIYPSLVAIEPRAGEVKDSAQVRAIARHFARLDERDGLAEAFAGDPGLTPEERVIVESEEGWVLGVTTLPARREPRPGRRAKNISALALADEGR